MFDFTKAEDPPKEQKNSFISLLMGSMYPESPCLPGM